MFKWKSTTGLLCTSLIIVFVTYFVKSLAFKTMDFFTVYMGIPKYLCAVFITLPSVMIYLQTQKSNGVKIKELQELLAHSREHLGISFGISSLIFFIRSFYLSFYNFEGSLTSLYIAFLFVLTSIVVTYGKTRIPSSEIVVSASHTSLAFAFLGLVLIITSMLKSAFVICFTATFLLIVSGILFIMNIIRSEPVTDGLKLKDGGIFENLTEHFLNQNFDEIAEEVFDNKQECDLKFEEDCTLKKLRTISDYCSSDSSRLLNENQPDFPDAINNDPKFEDDCTLKKLSTISDCSSDSSGLLDENQPDFPDAINNDPKFEDDCTLKKLSTISEDCLSDGYESTEENQPNFRDALIDDLFRYAKSLEICVKNLLSNETEGFQSSSIKYSAVPDNKTADVAHGLAVQAKPLNICANCLRTKLHLGLKRKT